MNIVICITIIAITGVLLIKRYQPQPVLIGMGILMIMTCAGYAKRCKPGLIH